jgi:hypothetical protein
MSLRLSRPWWPRGHIYRATYIDATGGISGHPPLGAGRHGFYRTAQAEARRLNVELKWTLQTVPDVGHDNAKMAPAAARAFFDGKTDKTR